MGTKLGSNSFFAFGHPDIAASVRLLCAETGTYHSVQDGDAYSSDNVPFGDLGIPSGTFGRSGGNSMFGHTTEDGIEHCSADALERSGKFIEKWMRRYVASPPVFPFERTIPPAAQQNLKEYLKARGILDWYEENKSD
jgi:Zn-dependent M28 family amino/carboxypeptidase